MSATVAVPASEAPSTPQELVDWDLDPGDAAAHVFDPEFYIVARTHAIGGVIEAVPIDELRDADAIDGPEEALAAVVDDEVAADVIPARFLVPLLEEFIDAEHRGEWSGVRDYLRESDR
jgi:hypothetical protein